MSVGELAEDASKRVAKAANLTQEQQLRLKDTLADMAVLLIKISEQPANEVAKTELEMCRITIESLAAVSINNAVSEAKAIALEIFKRGIVVAASSLL